jgi:2,4-dienoyl-CoA reductase-like NADH-dependent reductase (Old Yellow Enzyme family)/thioredoxin reductase
MTDERGAGGQGTVQLEQLFTPIQVGPMRVPNRICETTNTIGAGRLGDFLPDDVFIEHHVAKARGGMGWIGGETWILNAPLPDEVPEEIIPGGAATRFPIYYLPDFVPKVARFCQAVHDAGAVAVFQLTQLNAMFGPSSVPISGAYDWVPHELEDHEIDVIVESYAAAAGEILAAGGDGVEVHAAHETVPHLFLSPATNHRTDRWGGDARQRCGLLVTILQAIRARVGDGLAVGFRMAAGESRPGGYTLDDAVAMMRCIVAEAGPDFVNVDIGHSWGDPSYVPPSYYPVAIGADAAKAIREAARPAAVLYAGRVFDPLVAERLLADGVCDLVGMTRASIVDPEFATKAREGRLEEIRYCIGCNRCIDNAVHGAGTGLFTLNQRAMCSINPQAGAEFAWKTSFRPASTRKRVVVVGAGPAGLEAARVAALRGHEVIVTERRAAIGGQVHVASLAPGREQFANLARYHDTQVKLLGIDLRLGVDATPDAVLALAPNAVVCATGSIPLVPEVPGVDGPDVVQAWDVLEGKVEIGHRVVVVSQEDGMETPSVADFLASRGHAVEVFHHWGGVANAVGRYTLGPVLRRLEAGGVVSHSHLRVSRIEAGAVEFVSALTGAARVVEGVDTVVLSCGSRPDVALYRALKDEVARADLVGAAWAPRGIHEATEHGMRVGLEV